MAATRRISLLGAAATVAVLFALPAAASADVYCVDTGPTGCDHTGYTAEPGLQNALNDAEAHSGADTVMIAQLEYDTTTPDGFAYIHSGDPITIEGVGLGALIAIIPPGSVPVNPTAFLGLEVDSGGAPVTLSNLHFTLPTPPDEPDNVNQHYIGVRLHDAATVDGVTIDGPAGVSINGVGIDTSGGTVSNLTIDLPTTGFGNQGLSDSASHSAELTVQDSSLTADLPVSFFNTGAGHLLVRRSTLRAGPNGGIGVWMEVGQGTIESTMIDLGGFTASDGVFVGFNNFAPHTAVLNLDGVTIAHGGSQGRGLVADAGALGGAGDQFTLNARNTIIDPSVHRAIFRRDDAGALAQVNTAYSNYDPANNFNTNDGNNNGGTPGLGSISATNVTNLAPGFVSATDFHLLGTSPLIDIGDPDAPVAGAVDFDGDPRALLAKPGCAPRRDIGADEFAPASALTPLDCAAPDTTVSGKPKVRTRKKRALVTFTFSASEPGATFACSLDGRPFSPCAAPFNAKVRPGSHTLAVRATDASGNTDQSPGSFTTRVKRKRR